MIPTTTRVRANHMTDAERIERHARSMALYETAGTLYMFGTVSGSVGIVFWPMLIVAVSLLVAGMLVTRRADRISPYGDKTC